jgi:hypothetical protein
MPNPFPGIDPYVESQLTWRDFHTRFLTYLGDAINDRLPERYLAMIEGEVSLVAQSGDDRSRRVPDLAVTVDPLRASPKDHGAATGTALMMEPVTVPLATEAIEVPAARRWIEIRRQPDRSLVAVIELLSPSNKFQPGWTEYIEKRLELIHQPIHLVELDFLIEGHRLPMNGALPRGDYYAFVSRAGRRPDSEVYGWSVRQPLRAIPLPLDPPDPDLPLDLAVLYATAHARARYSLAIHYDRPLGLPLAPDDLAWAEATARQWAASR